MTNQYKFNPNYVEAMLKNRNVSDVTADDVIDMYGVLIKGEDKEWSEADNTAIEQNLDRLINEVREYKDKCQSVTNCNALTSETRIHAEFPPSSLAQYAQCPASWYMQQGIQEEPSEAAIEGTMLHDILGNGRALDGLTDEQQMAVEKCREFEAAETAGMETMHETRLEIMDEDKKDVLTFGYADVVAVDKANDRALVIDWKFGRNPVQAKGNYQLAAYAGAVMQKYGVSAVEGIIFQPRIGAAERYTFRMLGGIIKNIRTIIAGCKGNDLIQKPGEACRYCKAKTFCPAFQRMNSSLASARRETLATMTDEQLSAMMDQAKQVAAFTKDIDEELRKRIAEHGKCGNWVTEERQGNREIEDICKARFAVSDELTDSEFLDQCKCSAAGLIGALAAKIDAPTKKKQKAKAEEILQDVITRGKPTLMLKRVED